jgi:hypothetical protein
MTSVNQVDMPVSKVDTPVESSFFEIAISEPKDEPDEDSLNEDEQKGGALFFSIDGDEQKVIKLINKFVFLILRREKKLKMFKIFNIFLSKLFFIRSCLSSRKNARNFAKSYVIKKITFV